MAIHSRMWPENLLLSQRLQRASGQADRIDELSSVFLSSLLEFNSCPTDASLEHDARDSNHAKGWSATYVLECQSSTLTGFTCPRLSRPILTFLHYSVF